MSIAVGTSSLGSMVTPEALENAAKEVDRQLAADRQFPELSELINASQQIQTTFSGINDFDYPSLSSPSVGLAGLELVSLLKRVPLPAELMEQFNYMQCNCMMGLFPEIRRAWLTIDSNIYVWNYEDGSDSAYFDGLDETILCAGLVKAKPEIFKDEVRHILCLTTPVDIVLLAVTFTSKKLGSFSHDEFSEMHLHPNPVFSIPSDNIYMTCITGTQSGRIFMGGKDGCVYEVAYQAAAGWLPWRNCRKINHSSGTLSFLVPSFLSSTFSGEDAIAQLAVDNTRNTLYARSEKGTIQVFDLGADGQSMDYVASLTQDKITHKAESAARTNDRNLFKPIVHIAPIAKHESKGVHLVAITHAGVRLYFSTTNIRTPLERPTKLQLVHIRLPPGFAPSATSQKPSKVHAAFYRQGISLMAASQTEDMDVLWGISPDSFPFQTPLKEMQVTVPMDGRTWSLSEVPEFGNNMLSHFPIVRDQWMEPPAVVRQHASPRRSYVALSSQGSYLFTTYRPVEQLQQLLIQSQGFDSDSVHAFFKCYKEDQACATCLVIACSTQTSQQQIAEWATRAFFKYGESVSHHPSQAGTPGNPAEPSITQGGSYVASPGVRQGFNSPGVVTSTPHPGGVGQAVVRAEVIRSSKYDGLCMYFARILEMVWDARLVFEDFLVPHLSEPQQHVPVLRSVLNVDQLGWILGKLRQLQTWIEQNFRFLLPDREGGFPGVTMSGMQPFLQQTHPGSNETINPEKNFVINFKSLVDRSVETLSLWQVLNEHNIEDVILHLDTTIRDRLKHVKFRDLATKGQEICSALIASLINCYLDDGTSTDIISEKLREVCPHLFSNDDAVSSKAGELLMLAKQSKEKAEQESILKDALRRYRQVTHQINLELICSLFESVRFYDGVVELSLYAALKRDSQGMALHFYRNGEPHGDMQGREAFIARQQCYKCILDCLQRLLVIKTTPSQSPGLPSRPGPPPAPDPSALTPHDAEKHMEDVLSSSLSYGDELWHVVLYQWLIDNGLTERLLEIKSPHLEVFLRRSSSQDQPNEFKMLDLLWKHYEKTKNYSAAARILSKLSEKQSPGVTLVLRLEYLARAIMSAKSCNLRTAGSGDGEFLHGLEEKLEVARIQMQVYQALVRINSANPSRRIDQALIGLNSQLFDVTKLYGDFADEFDLSECKLAIVHCAGHYDPTLIETLWRDIIEAELRDSLQNPPSDRMAIVSKKIAYLGKVYVHSERYFPLGAIILMLEKKSAELVWDPTWVFMTMLEMGIPFPVLHAIYDKLFKAKDQCWRTQDKPLHILEVIYHLFMKFVNTPTISPPHERRKIAIALYDACATYLVELQSSLSRDPSVQNTLDKFQGLQTHNNNNNNNNNNNIEALWLEVFPFKSNRPILFAGIYRPPSTNLSEDEAIENMLELVYLLNLETIITGDININFISPAYKKHPLGRAFSNMNFKQLITEVTRPSSGTCLDFVLSNFPERIKSIVVKNNGLSDHLPVFGVRLYEDNAKRQNKSLTIKYRNTKHFDKSAFVSDLKEVPWNTAFVFDDLTDILNAWMGLFINILDAHCPWRVKKVAKQNQAPWMTVNILQALRRRDSLLRKARQSRCVTDWNCFKIARNKVVNMIRSAKYKYYNTCFNNNKGNSKKMWKTIKSLMGDVSKSVETPNVVLAEKFNDHFTSIADSLRNLLPNVPYCNSKVENFVCSRKDPDVLFNIPPVTKDFVLGALLGLKTNKAMGIDKISARYLKIAGPAIAYSITQILNISINSGVFPDCWKIAKVIPLFKSGDREDPDNYRPISILPVLSKILERHIHDHLYNYLCENNLLYPLQSGFRKHHGTDTALIRVIDNLLFNLDNDQVSGLLLVDYRKAFDMVDREILLQKLNAYGLTPVASKWFSSYLTDRHQFIAIDNVTSDSTLVRHGVPQGSILGPLLFVIYINDLPLHVNGADLDLYADDTTLTLSADISAVDSLQDSLAASLKEIECWTHTNKLPLNEKKTKTLLVTGKRLGKKLPDGYNLSLKTMNGVSLEQVPSAKLLGIDIDHDLSMNTYVDRLCKKISQRIGILNKIKLCLPFNQRLLFYNSLIKPLFDYANVAWQSLCSNESLLRILRLQKRAARVLLDAEPRSSSVMLFNRLKWIPFYDSTKMAKCSILFKRINYCVPNYLNDSLRLLSSVHSRNTRFCKYNFLLPKFKRAREGGKTFLVSAIKLWNQLKPELKKSNTLKAFKDNVFKYYYKDQSCLAHFNP